MTGNFVEELKWRGMLQDVMPGTEELLAAGTVSGYAGFDPTASSLTIGNLVAIMLLVHFQRSGHRPVVLVGGATGMIGDPSGKSSERNFLSEEALRHNQECIRKQLEKFLDFSGGTHTAEMVNNFDWISSFSYLDFLREVGKHLTVNYMIAKDSVQRRLENGLSYTEFSYQLIQGFDFLWLYQNKGCRIQMGGSDQWGNITAGAELIRRKIGGEAYALTCPLLTKADGTKFGKSEGGENIWLDAALTSPYRFYQFWLNAADGDVSRYLRIFSILTREEIEALEQEQQAAPHLRPMQKALAREVTVRVHSEADYKSAVEASEILFGAGTAETLLRLSERDLVTIFEGVPGFKIGRDRLAAGITAIDLLSVETAIFSSKGEARRMIQNGGVSINKVKISDAEGSVSSDMLLKGKYLVVQKGKKNYHLVTAE